MVSFIFSSVSKRIWTKLPACMDQSNIMRVRIKSCQNFVFFPLHQLNISCEWNDRLWDYVMNGSFTNISTVDSNRMNLVSNESVEITHLFLSDSEWNSIRKLSNWNAMEIDFISNEHFHSPATFGNAQLSSYNEHCFHRYISLAILNIDTFAHVGKWEMTYIFVYVHVHSKFFSSNSYSIKSQFLNVIPIRLNKAYAL